MPIFVPPLEASFVFAIFSLLFATILFLIGTIEALNYIRIINNVINFEKYKIVTEERIEQLKIKVARSSRSSKY